jgi:hypothetical protein
VRSTPIEQKKCGDPWKVLCLGLFVLGSGTLRAQTPVTEAPAETRLLKAAKVYFGNDIKPAEEKLFRQAANGLPADFTTGNTGDDSPDNAAAWKDDRVIRANRLAWLLVNPQASSQIPPPGVFIDGARIDGEVDLVATKVSFPIRISHSSLTNSIDLRRASLRILDLEGSHIKGLVGDGLNVERDVFLCCGFKSEGQFWLRSATIGGALVCTDGQFLNRQGFALLAEGAKIGGPFFMNGGFRAEGEVQLLNATITENFECNGGAFLNEKGLALNSENVTFDGEVHCGYGFTSIGEFDFSGATIKGTADFSGGSFTNKGGNRLTINADSAIFEQYILFGSGFKSDGCVWLRAAHIKGDLDVADANFSNPNGIAMNLTYAKIGTLHFYHGAKINGQIRLVAATIDTSLCWEGLEQPKRAIWDLSHAKVNPPAVQRQSWHSRQPADVWFNF